MLWISLLAIIGFLLSWFIFSKKKRNKKLVCFIGKDCNKVLYSKYSKLFFGISNEALGMVYYGVVVLFAILFFLEIGQIGALSLMPLLLIITGVASVFSLVLIYLQAFVIREWCEYCLMSAGINIVIFILELVMVL